MVGAGDLGTTAYELDEALTTLFALASAWKAIVLIDEADVFLERRDVHDLVRNAMVAVFLRQLECVANSNTTLCDSGSNMSAGTTPASSSSPRTA